MHIGQKVEIYGNIGYLVSMNIDPLEECEVKYETITYTIRVFQPWYKDGYADFHRGGRDLMQMHREGEFKIL